MPKVNPWFRGMMPVMPTPITENGEIDENSLRRLVEHCLACGAVALGHLGGASEYYKVPLDDRPRIIETVVATAAGRAPVFIGVGSASTRTSVLFAKEAERLGADLLMAPCPDRDVPGTEGMYDHYKALAEAVSIPIIIQDTGLSDAVLTPEFIARLGADFPNYRYAKLEGRKYLNKIADSIALLGDSMQVIGGAGGKHLIHMLRLGAQAFMTGTEALDIHNACVQAYLAGDEEEAARQYFDRVLPYLMFYMDYNRELLKGMLNRRGVIEYPSPLPPIAAPAMSDIERREFEWVLKRIGFGDG